MSRFLRQVMPDDTCILSSCDELNVGHDVKIHVMKFASAHVRKYVTARQNLCHAKFANPHLEMNLVFLQQCMSQYVSNFSLHVKICKGRFARSVDVGHVAEYMSEFSRLHVRLHVREQTRIQQELVYQNKCQDFSVKANARTDVSPCGRKDVGIFACQRAVQNVDVLMGISRSKLVSFLLCLKRHASSHNARLEQVQRGLYFWRWPSIAEVCDESTEDYKLFNISLGDNPAQSASPCSGGVRVNKNGHILFLQLRRCCLETLLCFRILLLPSPHQT
jgi:hypothetical protein